MTVMGSAAVVEATRRALGPVGAFLPVPTSSAPSADLQRDGVRRLERAGYTAAWTNEGIGGKDALVQLAVLLAATERMVFGTGIANIWARSPQTMHGGAALLAQAYPDRFVLGIGVGYPQQAESVGRVFGKPLATMRDYVDRMSAPPQLPAPEVSYPRVIGAMGPKMLALAAEITDGAMPAMVEPEFTATARHVLGPDKLLIVLIDGSVEKGDSAAIAATANAHAAAGADHVVVSTRIGTDYADGVDRLERLAPDLLKAG
jgi:probable F420-dependent oxidoreductase